MLGFCVLWLSTWGWLQAQTAEALRKKHANLDKKAIAIKGYDPVAYFTSNKASKGKKDLIHTHQGITYRFANPNNRDLFKQNPDRYEPQFGGWCAYAMAKEGEKVDINPKRFSIEKGKLYLFFDGMFANTLKQWQDEDETFRQQAHTHWSEATKE